MFPILFNRPKIVTASAFSPADIAGLVAWYDFSDATTMYQDSGKVTPVASDGDPIGLIENKINPGTFDLLQGTTANKPTYKIGIQNGLSVARSEDGSTDWLVHTLAAALTERTIIGVGFLAINAWLHDGGTISYESAMRRSSAGGTPFQIANSTFLGSAGDANWHNFRMYFNNTASNDTLDVDGVNVVDADAGNRTQTKIRLFNRYLQDTSKASDIGEVLIYNIDLPAGDKTSADLYIKTKWDTP